MYFVVFRHVSVGAQVEVIYTVIGGTSGQAILYKNGSSEMVFKSKPGESMTNIHRQNIHISAEGRYVFCVEAEAASIIKKACARCDTLPHTMPKMLLHSTNWFEGLVQEEFEISITILMGTFIRGLTMTVYWDDGSPNSTVVDYDPDSIIKHVYASAGSYTVLAGLTASLLTTANLRHVMTVYPIIEDMRCTPLYNVYFLKPSERLTIIVYVQASGTFNVNVEGEGITSPPPESMVCE